MKTKKVLFIPTLNAVISYYRMEQFVNKLREHKDLEVAYSYHGPDFTGTCEWEHNVGEVAEEFNQLFKTADIAIFGAVHTKEAVGLIQCLRDLHKIPIYCEYDDSPYNVSASHPNYSAIAPGSKTELWQNAQIKRSTGVICSTKYLANEFRTRNKNTVVIPNSIDFKHWDNLKKPQKSKKIRIGWSGGANHKEDLELIEIPIKKLLKKHTNVEFVLLYGGEIPEEFKDVQGIITYDFHHWKPINEYPGFLKSLGFDIGLAPLRDTSFNRCKSNLKWLEYSALRIPTVASPVEPYKDVECLHAKSAEDWFNQIELLIETKT